MSRGVTTQTRFIGIFQNRAERLISDTSPRRVVDVGRVFFAAACIIVCCCASAAQSADVVSPGVVIPKVVCSDHPQQSYACICLRSSRPVSAGPSFTLSIPVQGDNLPWTPFGRRQKSTATDRRWLQQLAQRQGSRVHGKPPRPCGRTRSSGSPSTSIAAISSACREAHAWPQRWRCHVMVVSLGSSPRCSFPGRKPSPAPKFVISGLCRAPTPISEFVALRPELEEVDAAVRIACSKANMAGRLEVWLRPQLDGPASDARGFLH